MDSERGSVFRGEGFAVSGGGLVLLGEGFETLGGGSQLSRKGVVRSGGGNVMCFEVLFARRGRSVDGDTIRAQYIYVYRYVCNVMLYIMPCTYNPSIR